MKFHIENSLIPKNTITGALSLLDEYKQTLVKQLTNHAYVSPESLVNLPYDEDNLSNIMQMKELFVSKALKYIIVVGIGGSNLGTKTVYDALYGHSDMFEPHRHPKIIFLETLNASYTKKALMFLAKEVKTEDEILTVLITKSGTTAETLINFEILSKALPIIKHRTIYIANEQAPLIVLAKKRKLPFLTIPMPVPGRFSVFSPAGLFPLACAGVDVISLLEGAMETMECHFKDKSLETSALATLIHYREGKIIHENFLFDARLDSLGKWQRQLTAESLGKKSRHGNAEGIQPSYSIGTTDLHSMFQLFLGGPQLRYFTFTHVAHLEHNTIKETKGKVSDTSLLKEIYRNVKTKFSEENIPFCEFILDSVSEKELGAYLQFKMLETMFVGHLLNINTFDQPNVDAYKKEVNDRT